jgi:putative hemolysin
LSGLALIGLIIALLLILFGAILAVAETALTHLTIARAEVMFVDDERKPLIIGLLNRRAEVLNPILLFRLACQLGAATIVGVVVGRRIDNFGVVITFLGLLTITYVFGEALPKAYALRYPAAAAGRVAPLVGGLMRTAPIRWVTSALTWLSNRLLRADVRRSGPAITESELLAFAAAAAEAEAIEPAEGALIQSVIEFGDTVAREAMLARPDMVTIERTATVSSGLDVALEHGYSRLPVIGDDIDDVVGVVHTKDLVRAEREGGAPRLVESITKQVSFVPETKTADSLLREMQANARHLAIVVDEYGSTAGLVTLEDLIEELVGEIVDEFDSVDSDVVETLADGAVRVHGRMPVDELNEMVGTALPDDDWDTVGGLIFNTLGHIPAVGESVACADAELFVEVIEGRRITQVRVRPMPQS